MGGSDVRARREEEEEDAWQYLTIHSTPSDT